MSKQTTQNYVLPVLSTLVMSIFAAAIYVMRPENMATRLIFAGSLFLTLCLAIKLWLVQQDKERRYRYLVYLVRDTWSFKVMLEPEMKLIVTGDPDPEEVYKEFNNVIYAAKIRAFL